MKQLIIISISVISFFIVLSMVTYSPPVPLGSSKIDYSKSWRLQGGLPMKSQDTQKYEGRVFNVVIIKDKDKNRKVKSKPILKNNYEIIDLKKQYLKWSQ